MIRWLSEVWVSGAIDRGGEPPRLWRWTFGRLESHRRFASELRQLDGQLRRQATSQQRAIARDPFPVGDYPARSKAADAAAPRPATGWFLTQRRPALAVAFGCAVLAVSAWIAWPSDTPQGPDDGLAATRQAIARIWAPVSEQAQSTGQVLRNQTTQLTSLPDRVPQIDRVVNDLGLAIETPLREEMRRLAADIARPWTYLAGQIPVPARTAEPDQTQG